VVFGLTEKESLNGLIYLMTGYDERQNKILWIKDFNNINGYGCL
jgi:hypothetical protein